MDAFDIIAVLVALFPVLVLVVVNAAESLKSDPQLSNREHERRTGTHKNTVQAVREELEGSGQIAHFEKRQDPRTGNLSQPASQPPRPEPELDIRSCRKFETNSNQKVDWNSIPVECLPMVGNAPLLNQSAQARNPSRS